MQSFGKFSVPINKNFNKTQGDCLQQNGWSKTNFFPNYEIPYNIRTSCTNPYKVENRKYKSSECDSRKPTSMCAETTLDYENLIKKLAVQTFQIKKCLRAITTDIHTELSSYDDPFKYTKPKVATPQGNIIDPRKNKSPNSRHSAGQDNPITSRISFESKLDQTKIYRKLDEKVNNIRSGLRELHIKINRHATNTRMNSDKSAVAVSESRKVEMLIKKANNLKGKLNDFWKKCFSKDLKISKKCNDQAKRIEEEIRELQEEFLKLSTDVIENEIKNNDKSENGKDTDALNQESMIKFAHTPPPSLDSSYVDLDLLSNKSATLSFSRNNKKYISHNLEDNLILDEIVENISNEIFLSISFDYVSLNFMLNICDNTSGNILESLSLTSGQLMQVQRNGVLDKLKTIFVVQGAKAFEEFSSMDFVIPKTDR